MKTKTYIITTLNTKELYALKSARMFAAMWQYSHDIKYKQKALKIIAEVKSKRSLTQVKSLHLKLAA